MDGIFVAYHNTQKIFGFQYISREEMDARLFGNSLFGDQAFAATFKLFSAFLNSAVTHHPNKVLIKLTIGSAYNIPL